MHDINRSMNGYNSQPTLARSAHQCTALQLQSYLGAKTPTHPRNDRYIAASGVETQSVVHVLRPADTRQNDHHRTHSNNKHEVICKASLMDGNVAHRMTQRL